MRLRSFFLRSLALLLGVVGHSLPGRAEPLSKKIELDFFREVPSRNLHGLASRSDGRLVNGPVLTELTGDISADLLWCIAPAGNNTWLIGTGPDGKIIEATLDSAKATFTTREYAKLDQSQVYALARLSDGSVLAGTSPNGGLLLLRDGKVVASVALPVDSIFDILEVRRSEPTTAGAPTPVPAVLVATGNPARIYQIAPDQLAAAGIDPVKVTDAKRLAEKGVSLFGEIRDRNVRRLARLGDAVVAGSSPKGNIYRFPLRAPNAPQTSPVDPIILQENRDAEVTGFLAEPNGDLFATLVFTAAPGDARINSAVPKPKEPGKDGAETNPLASLNSIAPIDRFSGRSSVVHFPANRFPETLTSRPNVAFYQVARSGDTLLIAGGEQGELLGYDLASRFALTFAGSTSSQLNALAPVPGAEGKFLLLRNNAPGLALLDFNSTAERSAETRRLDLATPATFGAFRFSRLRDVAANQLTVEIKTSFGSDEVEGWTPWTPLTATDPADPAWRAPDLRGRYAKLRLKLAPLPNGPAVNASRAATAAPAPTPELDKAEIYFLPQNRRPLLQEFRLLSPNVGLVPASEPSPSFNASLGQIISNSGEDDPSRKRGKNFLSSQVVPSPGTRVAFWTVTDPDGDNLAVTFSIRREDQTAWTDLAVASREPYAQFETSRLTDGVYFTRISATELAPRPTAERLSVTFETDKLIIDHTPPAIVDATAKSAADRMTVSIHGRDALSLLDGIEVVFNNGLREELDQPADGIRDGREETFTLEVPLAKTAGATAAEVTLYDDAGNAATRRLTF